MKRASGQSLALRKRVSTNEFGRVEVAAAAAFKLQASSMALHTHVLFGLGKHSIYRSRNTLNGTRPSSESSKDAEPARPLKGN
jgi:hypothetical protein